MVHNAYNIPHLQVNILTGNLIQSRTLSGSAMLYQLGMTDSKTCLKQYGLGENIRS
jgi:hypothetical protein